MRRVLKVLVVLAGSFPALYFVLMILARLNVPRVTIVAQQLLQLDYVAFLEYLLVQLASTHLISSTVPLPPVDYRALARILLALALPAGLAGLAAMFIPIIRKSREEVSHGWRPSLAERFSEWRTQRRTNIETRRRREEEAEAEENLRKARERKRREGLNIRDLLQPEELPS